MYMAYSNCNVNNLAYHTCKYAEKIFNNGVMAISTNLNHAFDITRPCAICEKTGHSFDDCEELRGQAAIWKSYIQLCVVLQKLKGIAVSQGCDLNFLRAYKLSYVKSVNLHPSSSPLDSVAANRLNKLEGMLVKSIKSADQTNRRLNSLTSKFAVNKEEEENDDDNDEDS